IDKMKTAEKVESVLESNKRGELKNLNIEPLSIAKYFYEKGANNIALIQRLIYLSFLKVLEEENTLLFAEEWQA
ncbi:15792_t:CDS:1, partial [Racocetra persica]